MIRLATVFSGIGAVEQALEKDKIDYEIVFACDNGERELEETKEEILEKTKGYTLDKREQYVNDLYNKLSKPNYMEMSYKENYKINDEDFHQDIRFINGKKYEGKIDLLVGGSPCQSFSIIGKRGGFKDTRGTLFYEYARLVDETKPKVFIFENVRGMLNHDKGKTWEVVQNTFKELNYKIYIRSNPILNARDYGIPQNRPRLFVVGIRNDIECKDFEFPKEKELKKTVKDFLDDNLKVDPKYYLGQKGFEFVTNPKYRNRAQVNSDVMQCQKANQQFNWNGEFVFVPLKDLKENKEILEKAFVSKYNGVEGVARKLTPLECVRLMGFSNKFKFPEIPDQWKYRQSGNSIVVNIFEELLKEIEKTGVWEVNND